MNSNKEFDSSGIDLARANKNDLKLLVAFSKRMRRQNIKILPVDGTEIFEKYRDYDNIDELNLFILKYGKSIIGCAGYLSFNGLLGGKKISGIVASSGIVDPAYRKLFPTATVLLGRSYKTIVFRRKLFTLFFPFDEEMSLAYKKRPFEHFAHIYQFTNPFIAKIKPTVKSSLIEIKKINCFDKKETNAFFKRVSAQHYFLMHTDSDFLNWKYANNPYRRFTILTAVTQAKFVGYIVAERIGTDIYIVDMVVDLDYPSATLRLMFKSFSYFDTETAVNTIFCTAHKSYIDILKKAGFFCSWKRECLFFPGGLDFFKISKDSFYSSNKGSYHFNGFARHLY
ncbi:MAG: hypothetical protein M0R20_01735 [Candidatus Omnitrophica bacterium]|jgi:hypothetical protein|nr:hypothetical protein [Candidatus Omnitrophota bacterium]